jgi:hypothetical protein
MPPAQPIQEFGFAEQVKKPTASAVLRQPVTIAAIILVIAVVALVVYLEYGGNRGRLPEIVVSYTLLPNEGRTEGVPISIKLNDIAVFVVSDPLQGGGGAARAQSIVDNLQASVTMLKAEPGKMITLDESGDLPAIVQQSKDGTERRVLIQLTPEDMTLASETDAKRLARVWAERLTDTVKLIAFGEPPEYSTGTEFGDALETLYAASRAQGGSVSEGSLGEAFEQLSDAQKLVLETVPPRLASESAGEEANAGEVIHSGQTFK